MLLDLYAPHAHPHRKVDEPLCFQRVCVDHMRPKSIRIPATSPGSHGSVPTGMHSREREHTSSMPEKGLSIAPMLWFVPLRMVKSEDTEKFERAPHILSLELRQMTLTLLLRRYSRLGFFKLVTRRHQHKTYRGSPAPCWTAFDQLEIPRKPKKRLGSISIAIVAIQVSDAEHSGGSHPTAPSRRGLAIPVKGFSSPCQLHLLCYRRLPESGMKSPSRPLARTRSDPVTKVRPFLRGRDASGRLKGAESKDSEMSDPVSVVRKYSRCHP